MRILFISHRIPYPPNKGEKIRSFHILRHLARNHDVYVACLIDDENDKRVIKDLSQLTSNPVLYDVICPFIKKLISSHSLILKQSLSVKYFYSERLQKHIDQLLDNVSIDLTFCSSSPTAEYVFRSCHYPKILRSARLIMDLIDVDSWKWKEYAEKRKWPLSMIYKLESKYLLAYEKSLAKNFDHILVVSEAEKKLLEKYVLPDKISSIPNGVDLNYFAPGMGSCIKKRSPMLVFVGAMDYWPNIEGVKWFANQVFPELRKNIPGVQFFIVGNNPDVRVKLLAKKKGIKVTGYVEDVRDYLNSADISVVPLLTARGIQNKVLEAMAMGKPVVCTPQALEGIEAVPGKDVIVEDRASGFAHSIKMLLVNQDLKANIGKNARKCVELRYSWGNNLRSLDKILSVPRN